MAQKEIELTGPLYMGEEKEVTVDGGWKIAVTGDDLVYYRKESGLWVEKTRITA